jgi:UDP-N-acetylglucosamine:LPS N-acetylglucosamine transferase
VLVVFSGSLGSRRVNEAVRGLASRWAERGDLAIRHVTGRRDYADFAGADLAGSGLVYQVVEYEDRMELLLSAADVAVTRAGGSVAELEAFSVPAVLVPLPIATRDHQTANATVLKEAGAAVMVPDHELTTDRLESELAPILADGDRRTSMSQAMRSLARLDAADRVATLIEEQARD